MTTTNTSRPEVWFFTSEIENERAGSFRQARWANVFLDAGAQIRVFNVEGAIRLTERPFQTSEDFSTFRDHCRATTRPAASVREGWYVRPARALKHLILADFYLPNILKLILRGRAHLKTGRRVILFASSPPFALAFAGWILKARFPGQVIFVVDMRDAWAFHTSLGGIRPLKRAIEKMVLRRADYVSTVSYGLANEFHSRHDVKVDVLYNVATHYFTQPVKTDLDWQNLNLGLAPGRLKLVYTGSTPVGFYNLGAIARGVVRLRQTHPALADRLQLVFVGACEEMRQEADAAGVTQNDIIFVGHVPHKLATSIQQAADGLLFLAYDGEGNKGVVSTKFFEYLALRKPILPIGLRPGSDVDQLLGQLCEASLILLADTEIASTLGALATDGLGELPRLKRDADLMPLFEAYGAYAARIQKTAGS